MGNETGSDSVDLITEYRMDLESVSLLCCQDTSVPFFCEYIQGAVVGIGKNN